LSTQRILIVGSGFAGMWAALAAARLLDQNRVSSNAVEIAVVSPEPRLHIRPRLYENDVTHLSVSLVDVFGVADVQYIQGSVDQIDVEASRVTINSGGHALNKLSYDRLVLASGSAVRDCGIPGLAQHGHNVDQLASALRLQRHIQSLGDIPDSVARNCFVVAGGGYTGIETAAELPARVRLVLGPRAKIEVIVLDKAAIIGPELGEGARRIVEEAFSSLGVRTRLKTSLISVEADSIEVSGGERIATKTLIWTAGMRASSLTMGIPGDRDHLGRLHVDSELRVRPSRKLFAAGDVALAASDEQGHYALMSCQHAMQLGRTAGNNAAADLLGLPATRYSQPKYITCLDLGPWGAVLTRGWERTVTQVGREAKAIKQHINMQRIYPPRAIRAEALAAADPHQPA
jgi:NADH dehydrogenase